jgi:hypothetical protein
MGRVANATPRPLYPRERHPVPIVASGPVWTGAEKSRPQPGFDPRTVQPVASSKTNWAVPTPTYHTVTRQIPGNFHLFTECLILYMTNITCHFPLIFLCACTAHCDDKRTDRKWRMTFVHHGNDPGLLVYLTPMSQVHLQKLLVSQQFGNLPVFSGMRWLITGFTTARRWHVSKATLIPSPPPHPMPLR